MHHDDVSAALRADLEGRGAVVGEVVQPADQIAGLDQSAQVHHRLPYSVTGTGDVVMQLIRLHERRLRRPGGPHLCYPAIEETVIPEDVQRSFVCVPYPP